MAWVVQVHETCCSLPTFMTPGSGVPYSPLSRGHASDLVWDWHREGAGRGRDGVAKTRLGAWSSPARARPSGLCLWGRAATVVTVVFASRWLLPLPLHLLTGILLSGGAAPFTPFTSSVSYVNINLWIFINFTLWVLHHYYYLFGCSNHSSYGHWRCFDLAHVSFQHVLAIF